MGDQEFPAFPPSLSSIFYFFLRLHPLTSGAARDIDPTAAGLLALRGQHPQLPNHDIRLTTPDRRFGRDPDYKSLRWLNGQSPPGLPDGLNRTLLQDIGLDRSRT